MFFRPNRPSISTQLVTLRAMARITTGPLTDIERIAVQDALVAGEQVRAVVRGADADDVFLWVATNRRALQFVHAVEGVFLLRLMPLAHLRSLHLVMNGEWAAMRLTSHKRTYYLDRLPREDAMHFAQQLGISDVLVTDSSTSSGSAI